jgi:hypothetical protein
MALTPGQLKKLGEKTRAAIADDPQVVVDLLNEDTSYLTDHTDENLQDTVDYLTQKHIQTRLAKSSDENGRNLLHVAVSTALNGFDDNFNRTATTIAELFSTLKDKVDKSNETPLHLAIRRHNPVLLHVLKTNENIDATNQQGQTALRLAIASDNSRNAELVRALITGDISSQITPADIEYAISQDKGYAAVMMIQTYINSGSAYDIQGAIKRAIDNDKNNTVITLLREVVQANRDDDIEHVIKYAINTGKNQAVVDMVNELALTPLVGIARMAAEHAIKSNNDTAARMLTDWIHSRQNFISDDDQKQADVRKQAREDLTYLWFLAAKHGNLATLENLQISNPWLLDKKLKLPTEAGNDLIPTKKTALHIAAENGKVNIVETLLNAKVADLENYSQLRDNEGLNALDAAALAVVYMPAEDPNYRARLDALGAIFQAFIDLMHVDAKQLYLNAMLMDLASYASNPIVMAPEAIVAYDAYGLSTFREAPAHLQDVANQLVAHMPHTEVIADGALQVYGSAEAADSPEMKQQHLETARTLVTALLANHRLPEGAIAEQWALAARHGQLSILQAMVDQKPDILTDIGRIIDLIAAPQFTTQVIANLIIKSGGNDNVHRATFAAIRQINAFNGNAALQSRCDEIVITLAKALPAEIATLHTMFDATRPPINNDELKTSLNAIIVEKYQALPRVMSDDEAAPMPADPAVILRMAIQANQQGNTELTLGLLNHYHLPDNINETDVAYLSNLITAVDILSVHAAGEESSQEETDSTLQVAQDLLTTALPHIPAANVELAASLQVLLTRIIEREHVDMLAILLRQQPALFQTLLRDNEFAARALELLLQHNHMNIIMQGLGAILPEDNLPLQNNPALEQQLRALIDNILTDNNPNLNDSVKAQKITAILLRYPALIIPPVLQNGNLSSPLAFVVPRSNIENTDTILQLANIDTILQHFRQLAGINHLEALSPLWFHAADIGQAELLNALLHANRELLNFPNIIGETAIDRLLANGPAAAIDALFNGGELFGCSEDSLSELWLHAAAKGQATILTKLLAHSPALYLNEQNQDAINRLLANEHGDAITTLFNYNEYNRRLTPEQKVALLTRALAPSLANPNHAFSEVQRQILKDMASHIISDTPAKKQDIFDLAITTPNNAVMRTLLDLNPWPEATEAFPDARFAALTRLINHTKTRQGNDRDYLIAKCTRFANTLLSPPEANHDAIIRDLRNIALARNQHNDLMTALLSVTGAENTIASFRDLINRRKELPLAVDELTRRELQGSILDAANQINGSTEGKREIIIAAIYFGSRDHIDYAKALLESAKPLTLPVINAIAVANQRYTEPQLVCLRTLITHIKDAPMPAGIEPAVENATRATSIAAILKYYPTLIISEAGAESALSTAFAFVVRHAPENVVNAITEGFGQTGPQVFPAGFGYVAALNRMAGVTTEQELTQHQLNQITNRLAQDLTVTVADLIAAAIAAAPANASDAHIQQSLGIFAAVQEKVAAAPNYNQDQHINELKPLWFHVARHGQHEILIALLAYQSTLNLEEDEEEQSITSLLDARDDENAEDEEGASAIDLLLTDNNMREPTAISQLFAYDGIGALTSDQKLALLTRAIPQGSQVQFTDRQLTTLNGMASNILPAKNQEIFNLAIASNNPEITKSFLELNPWPGNNVEYLDTRLAAFDRLVALTIQEGRRDKVYLIGKCVELLAALASADPVAADAVVVQGRITQTIIAASQQGHLDLIVALSATMPNIDATHAQTPTKAQYDAAMQLITNLTEAPFINAADAAEKAAKIATLLQLFPALIIPENPDQPSPLAYVEQYYQPQADRDLDRVVNNILTGFQTNPYHRDADKLNQVAAWKQPTSPSKELQRSTIQAIANRLAGHLHGPEKVGLTTNPNSILPFIVSRTHAGNIHAALILVEALQVKLEHPADLNRPVTLSLATLELAINFFNPLPSTAQEKANRVDLLQKIAEAIITEPNRTRDIFNRAITAINNDQRDVAIALLRTKPIPADPTPADLEHLVTFTATLAPAEISDELATYQQDFANRVFSDENNRRNENNRCDVFDLALPPGGAPSPIALALLNTKPIPAAPTLDQLTRLAAFTSHSGVSLTPELIAYRQAFANAVPKTPENNKTLFNIAVAAGRSGLATGNNAQHQLVQELLSLNPWHADDERITAFQQLANYTNACPQNFRGAMIASSARFATHLVRLDPRNAALIRDIALSPNKDSALTPALLKVLDPNNDTFALPGASPDEHIRYFEELGATHLITSGNGLNDRIVDAAQHINSTSQGKNAILAAAVRAQQSGNQALAQALLTEALKTVRATGEPLPALALEKPTKTHAQTKANYDQALANHAQKLFEAAETVCEFLPSLTLALDPQDKPLEQVIELYQSAFAAQKEAALAAQTDPVTLDLHAQPAVAPAHNFTNLLYALATTPRRNPNHASHAALLIQLLSRYTVLPPHVDPTITLAMFHTEMNNALTRPLPQQTPPLTAEERTKLDKDFAIAQTAIDANYGSLAKIDELAVKKPEMMTAAQWQRMAQVVLLRQDDDTLTPPTTVQTLAVRLNQIANDTAIRQASFASATAGPVSPADFKMSGPKPRIVLKSEAEGKLFGTVMDGELTTISVLTDSYAGINKLSYPDPADADTSRPLLAIAVAEYLEERTSDRLAIIDHLAGLTGNNAPSAETLEDAYALAMSAPPEKATAAQRAAIAITAHLPMPAVVIQADSSHTEVPAKQDLLDNLLGKALEASRLNPPMWGLVSALIKRISAAALTLTADELSRPLVSACIHELISTAGKVTRGNPAVIAELLKVFPQYMNMTSLDVPLFYEYVDAHIERSPTAVSTRGLNAIIVAWVNNLDASERSTLVHKHDTEGFTLLAHAVDRENLATTETLLTIKGIDVEAGPAQRSALAIASQKLAASAQDDSSAGQATTILMLEMLQKLVSKLSTVTTTVTPDKHQARLDLLYQLIAIAKNSPDQHIRKLAASVTIQLAACIDVDIPGVDLAHLINNATAFSELVDFDGHRQAGAALFQAILRSADATLQAEIGRLASEGIDQILLGGDGSPGNPASTSLLAQAAAANRKDLVDLIISTSTPAAASSTSPAVKLLRPDSQGVTAIHHAAHAGSQVIIDRLLDTLGDDAAKLTELQRKDTLGRTVLDHAILGAAANASPAEHANKLSFYTELAAKFPKNAPKTLHETTITAALKTAIARDNTQLTEFLLEQAEKQNIHHHKVLTPDTITASLVTALNKALKDGDLARTDDVLTPAKFLLKQAEMQGVQHKVLSERILARLLKAALAKHKHPIAEFLLEQARVQETSVTRALQLEQARVQETSVTRALQDALKNALSVKPASPADLDTAAFIIKQTQLPSDDALAEIESYFSATIIDDGTFEVAHVLFSTLATRTDFADAVRTTTVPNFVHILWDKLLAKPADDEIRFKFSKILTQLYPSLAATPVPASDIPDTAKNAWFNALKNEIARSKRPGEAEQVFPATKTKLLKLVQAYPNLLLTPDDVTGYSAFMLIVEQGPQHVELLKLLAKLGVDYAQIQPDSKILYVDTQVQTCINNASAMPAKTRDAYFTYAQACYAELHDQMQANGLRTNDTDPDATKARLNTQPSNGLQRVLSAAVVANDLRAIKVLTYLHPRLFDYPPTVANADSPLQQACRASTKNEDCIEFLARMPGRSEAELQKALELLVDEAKPGNNDIIKRILWTAPDMTAGLINQIKRYAQDRQANHPALVILSDPSLKNYVINVTAPVKSANMLTAGAGAVPMTPAVTLKAIADYTEQAFKRPGATAQSGLADKDDLEAFLEELRDKLEPDGYTIKSQISPVSPAGKITYHQDYSYVPSENPTAPAKLMTLQASLNTTTKQLGLVVSGKDANSDEAYTLLAQGFRLQGIGMLNKPKLSANNQDLGPSSTMTDKAEIAKLPFVYVVHSLSYKSPVELTKMFKAFIAADVFVICTPDELKEIALRLTPDDANKLKADYAKMVNAYLDHINTDPANHTKRLPLAAQHLITHINEAKRVMNVTLNNTVANALLKPAVVTPSVRPNSPAPSAPPSRTPSPNPPAASNPAALFSHPNSAGEAAKPVVGDAVQTGNTITPP